MNIGRIEIPFGAQNLVIESGKYAKQANGTVMATCGGTIVLVATCMAKKAREDIDFFPLMVEYQEKVYSAGRIPGGFFKREGRPTEKEILTSRLIDRPIRPLFPEGLFNDVQVVATVLSHDAENDPDVVALVGASAALMVSDIPFDGPIGAVRIGLIEDQFVLNPSHEQRENCEMDLIVAGHSKGIVMIEGEAKEIPEDKVAAGLKFALDAIKPIAEIQNKLREEIGKEKAKIDLRLPHPELMKKLEELTGKKVTAAYKIADKAERENALSGILDELVSDMSIFDEFKVDDREVSVGQIKAMFDKIEYEEVRRSIFEDNKRADGRSNNELRELISEVAVLPRTHGSSLFTRGQTQSLSVVTLGTRRDEQMMESLAGTTYRNFMLHYNFPPFSVGEARPMRGPGRREIGHGALAAKALKSVLPNRDDFPYTIRLVSEILESNGSSSMATVCAGTLALMDAGVPISDPVAGISVGLMTKGDSEDGAVLLTDIMGSEDHFGDMDYKIAGTRKGVTAIQLDLKIKKISVDLLTKGLAQANEARMQILDNMHTAISTPRAETSDFAPKIFKYTVNPDKIGTIIGPGGKMIKRIIEETGALSIDIDDSGEIVIAASEKESGEQALEYVKGLVEDPAVGKTYDGTVKKVMNFGAFVEFLPGREGLVHVSELSDTYVKDIEGVVKVGDQFKVKLIEIDAQKRINLSKKQADEE